MSIETQPRKHALKIEAVYSKVSGWSLYVLFFLLPVFFLPCTINALEVNKQSLLILLTLIALVLWLGSMVAGRRLVLRTGWLNLAPFLFLLSVFVSSLLSLAGFQTWIGQASQEYTSFLSILVLVLLFYVVANTCSETKVQQKLLFSLFLSAALAGLITLLSLLNIRLVPFDFAAIVGFNTVGTINSFAIFMIIVSLLGIGAWLVSKNNSKDLLAEGPLGYASKALITFLAAATLVVMFMADYWVLWTLMIVGIIVLYAFSFVRSQEFPSRKRFILPLLIMFFSIFMLYARTPVSISAPVVVSPNYGLSWKITRQVLQEDRARMLFGTGPGTFAYDYVQHKPVEVNNTSFWNVAFDRSKSHLITTLATMGIIGTLTWFLFVLFLLVKSLSRLIKERKNEEWKATYVVFGVWLVLVLSMALYSSNMTLQFLFWALSGVLAGQVMTKAKEIDFRESQKAGLLFSFAFVVAAVGVLVAFFVTGQRHLAEVAYAKAVRLDGQGAPANQVLPHLVQAAGYNRNSDIYYRNLSQALLVQVKIQLAISGESLTDQQSIQIKQLVSSSVNAAKIATDLEPNNVANWSVRGLVYREVMNLVRDADDFAAASFIRAAELEPVNPVHQANIGQIHLLVAERAELYINVDDVGYAEEARQAEEKELKAAEARFLEAIRLKPDYAPAHYYLAIVFEHQGRLNEATQRLEALRDNSPLDVGIGFQLGVLYLRSGEYDKAKAELERVVGLAPDYSNARWFLASAYEIQGDMGAARSQVEEVAAMNPDNATVQARLDKLRAGELTTKIPSPLGGEGETVEEPVPAEGEEAISGEDLEAVEELIEPNQALINQE